VQALGRRFAKEHGSLVKWHQNSHSEALAIIREKSEKGGEAGAERGSSARASTTSFRLRRAASFSSEAATRGFATR
jgi:hypothetical protein